MTSRGRAAIISIEGAAGGFCEAQRFGSDSLLFSYINARKPSLGRVAVLLFGLFLLCRGLVQLNLYCKTEHCKRNRNRHLAITPFLGKSRESEAPPFGSEAETACRLAAPIPWMKRYVGQRGLLTLYYLYWGLSTQFGAVHTRKKPPFFVRRLFYTPPNTSRPILGRVPFFAQNPPNFKK